MIMTPDSMQGASDYYVVPGRTLRGSKTEMLAEIDEVVQALMALRLVILTQDARSQSSSAANR
jgi:hypothetical protein